MKLDASAHTSYSFINTNPESEEFRQLVTLFPNKKDDCLLIGKPFLKQIDVVEVMPIPPLKKEAVEANPIHQVNDLKLRFTPIGCGNENVFFQSLFDTVISSFKPTTKVDF